MRSSGFSENTRVKLPALIHLTRLDYKYFSLKNTENVVFDSDTNIIKNVFREQFVKLNCSLSEAE
jgi:type I restriction enzyme R subunit